MNEALLLAALAEQERLGFLGVSPAEAVTHSRTYEAALPVGRRVVDLGSGGGLPGLVLAATRDDLRLTLLDARQKRTDQLRRLVGRLGAADRVDVVCARVEQYGRGAGAGVFDVVVARKFGPPTEVVAAARLLLRPEGDRLLVVSDAPDDRWDAVIAAEGLERREGPTGLVVCAVPQSTGPSE